jgi:uncharacterized membrane protein
VARALIILLLLAYPFGVYAGLERLGPAILGAVLAALLLVRLWVLGTRGLRLGLATALALTFVATLALTRDETLLKFYPVILNAGLFVLFAISLLRPPTVIERGLRLAGRDVPPEAPPYLWWVTLTWCGFFVINGAIAAWTALAAPLSWWTLYNGLISYGLMAVLFGAEWVARGVYRRRHARRQVRSQGPRADDPEPSRQDGPVEQHHGAG